MLELSLFTLPISCNAAFHFSFICYLVSLRSPVIFSPIRYRLNHYNHNLHYYLMPCTYYFHILYNILFFPKTFNALPISSSNSSFILISRLYTSIHFPRPPTLYKGCLSHTKHYSYSLKSILFILLHLNTFDNNLFMGD